MSLTGLKLSIIIVSYNTREMTLNCLNLLVSTVGHLEAEIWLVDNGSVDGTPCAVREAFPTIRVLRMPSNVGFGSANNAAMRRASGEYLLLLNSDAFPHDGAVQAMVDYLDLHPGVGVVGPRLVNADGSLQQSCFRFPSPTQAWLENTWVTALLPNHSRLGDYRRWPHDHERDVDFVSGACLMLRRRVYDGVGGFDPGFFMYSEESDLQRRIADAGWRIAFTPSAVVTHLGGASGGTAPVNLRECFFESLDRYARKHHGIAGAVSFRAAMIVGCFLRALAWSSVILLRPRTRQSGISKLRLQAWLLKRQATQWGTLVSHARLAREDAVVNGESL